ncbi:hypothetical protein [Acinetobacter rudis]|uniref:hypothetical protein n=1 Tax=Acinetobacter rudis TaxID=632955 RepID=UPI003340EAC0
MGLNGRDVIKTNEWITSDEKKLVNNLTNHAQKNIGMGLAVGMSIQQSVERNFNQVKAGANIAYNNTRNVVNWATPKIQEGGIALYNDVKTAGHNAYQYAKEKGKEGVRVANAGFTLATGVVATGCYTGYGCKLPDYLYCSHSGTRRSAGVAVNLWSGQSYAVIGVDATYVPKEIYKGVLNNATDIKKCLNYWVGNVV